jgi:GT2 family glycosyltransferase
MLHRPAGVPRRPGDAADVSAVVGDHLARRAPGATLEPLADDGGFRVRHPIAAPPLASLIVCVRDQPALLKAFLETLERQTDYPARELILLDNGSVEPATLDLLAGAAAAPGVRLIRAPGRFNFASLNNRGAEAASGEVLVLLNSDLEFHDPDWLTEMVSQAMRPDVGCVGAKLTYADGRIQHAGLVFAGDALAVHADRGAAATERGYLGRLRQVRQVSAVTAAALAVRRSSYLAVEGMDAVRFPVAFNDIDLCLRLERLGLRTIWTPFAEIMHKESSTRGSDASPAQRERFLREAIEFDLAWHEDLASDRFFSSHLEAIAGRALPRP